MEDPSLTGLPDRRAARRRCAYDQGVGAFRPMEWLERPRCTGSTPTCGPGQASRNARPSSDRFEPLSDNGPASRKQAIAPSLSATFARSRESYTLPSTFPTTVYRQKTSPSAAGALSRHSPLLCIPKQAITLQAMFLPLLSIMRSCPGALFWRASS